MKKNLVMKSFSISILSRVSDKRTEMMGFAMLLVLLYHYALHFGIYHSPIVVRGDIGVDIFLFLSGYGCCYSVAKHSLKDFYKNRIRRIIPIYLIIELVVMSCNYLLYGASVDKDSILCLFCLSFFVNGDLSVWYIHASMLLYALTPLLVSWLKGKETKTFFCMLLCVAAFVYLSIACKKSNLNVMLYRIPIYVFGIYWALVGMEKSKFTKNKLIGGVICYLVSMTILQIVLGCRGMLVHNQMRYILYLIITILLIYVLCLCLPQYRLLNWLGKCSLECYLVHQPIMRYFSFVENRLLFIAVSVITIWLCVMVFHSINVIVQKLLQ